MKVEMPSVCYLYIKYCYCNCHLTVYATVVELNYIVIGFLGRGGLIAILFCGYNSFGLQHFFPPVVLRVFASCSVGIFSPLIF